MKLYEITKEIQAINDELISGEGEISPELEARLDAVNLALEQKSNGIRKWMAIIDGNSDALNSEISRLQKMKAAQDRLKERLKEYVKKNMEAAGLKKIETTIGTFSIHQNKPSVEIVSEEMIPDNFLDIVPEHKEVNKKRISDAIKDGYDVPGAKLITDRTHLRIK